MMRFAFYAFLFASALFNAAAFGGGPDSRCQDARIETVSADESKIVLIISGRCELFLVDSQLPPREGSAKFVGTDLEHCVVTLVRRNEALEGMGFKSWKDCCDRATALSGKQAWLDLQGAVTIDAARVVLVRATAFGFGPREAPTTRAAAEPAGRKVNTPVMIASLKGDWERQPDKPGDFKEELCLNAGSTGQWHQSQHALPVSVNWFVEGGELRLEYYHDLGDFNWRVKTLRVPYILDGDTLTLTLDEKLSRWRRIKGDRAGGAQADHAAETMPTTLPAIPEVHSLDDLRTRPAK